jgi:hypothetical protein
MSYRRPRFFDRGILTPDRVLRLFRGTRLRNYGVIASASLSPDSKTRFAPHRRGQVRFELSQRRDSVLKLPFQSFQSSGTPSGQ